MPTETTLNSLKVHKVPDFETWEENYNQANGIGTSDVVVIPPEELKKGILPDQTNNSGKFLSTNGTSASWETVDALPSQSGNSGKFLTTNGTAASWSTVSIPSAADATPIMDGTAAVGTSTDYAREDHVHPTDTSRAASSHTHGNITSGGDITATAPTIANGDQIIINDNSASKITNGPTFDGSTTTKYLSQKGTWESVPTINYPVTSVNGETGAVVLDASDVNAVATSAVGANSGVAPLNASGKIDSTYLPSYVDDVIEGYYYNSKFYTTSAHTTEITGETGKIFVDLTTNKTYRYGGTSFTEISQGSVVSVSRDLTSGTKIGTLTINGTGTDLYAPTPETFTVTGGASTIVSDNLTANRALISNTSGKVAVSDVTSTELGYLDGVTSAIQTQLDNKQAKVTASGILKGDGSGGVSAATAGTDYQAPLPSQANNSGKFLTTNGSALSWGTVDALPSQTNNSGKFLTTNGTSASWATVSIPTVPTMDASPTDGNSSNTVSSNGVYDMVMGRTKVYTATCSTGASTAAKVATLDDSTGFSLAAGVKVAVTFTYGNSATTPTLNVNSSGAKTIAIPSSVTAYTTGNGATYNTWGAYETVLFTYTGTYWTHDTSGYLGYLAYNTASGRQAKITASGILKGDGSGGISAAVSGTDYPPVNHATTATTYGVGDSSNYGHVKLSDSTSSTNSTSNGTAATPAAVKSAYDLANGKQNKITANGILEGDGEGNISAAESLDGSLISTLSADFLEIDSTPTASSNNLVTSGGVYTAINNSTEVFVAEYNVTTYAEIKTAYDAGKTIFVHYDWNNENVYNIYAPLTDFYYVSNDLNNTYFKFTFSYEIMNYTIICYNVVHNNDTWSIQDYNLSPPSASTTTPSMDGTASYGSGTTWARADHVHPSDTSRQSQIKTGTITTTTTWSGSGPYTQTVTLSSYTATANTKVDIQLTAAQIVQLITDGVTSLLVSNSNGTLTMYATGAAPTTAMTIQVTCTEVTAA